MELTKTTRPGNPGVSSASSPPRVLLLGLDAACEPVLDQVTDAGVAPTLAQLVDRGVAGPLESQHPPWTPSAWPSLYTGVNPGKHGVFDFLTFDGYDWDVVNHTCVREWTLWETLARHGYTSVVVNVPVTHPPRAFDGALVPGYTAPEDPTCHPDGVLATVREAVPDYTVYSADTDGRDAHVEELQRLVRTRGQVFRHLADRYDPDFGFLQFQATDTVFHELPGDDDAVAAVYDAVDEQVRATVDAFDPDTVLVVSDHGIGPYAGYEFNVNEFLRRHGYLSTRRGGEGMPSWSSIARTRLRNGESGGRPTQSATARVAALAARAGLTSQRLQRLLATLGLDEVVARHAPTDAIRAGTRQVDFDASMAYMRSRIECGIRLNVVGREPAGTVAPAEYDQVREELMALLADVRTPDGDRVFEAVRPREAVFDGPAVAAAADIQVTPTDYDHYLSATVATDTFSEATNLYNHKRDGLVVAAGDGVDTARPLDDAHLFDVTPTVLACYDIPAADRMDGAVLPCVDSAGRTTYPPFEGPARSETDDRAVEQRLSNLGYLE